MALIWNDTSSAGSSVGIWQVKEDLDELLERIPEEGMDGDPVVLQGRSRKRLERCAVRALIQELHPRALPLSYQEKRPVPNDPDCCISISHDHDMVAVQITPNSLPAGIDIQRIRPEQLERVAPRFLNQKELGSLDEWEEHERSAATNILWCAKEALYKAGAPYELRDGIRVQAFRSVDEGELTARTGMNGKDEKVFRLRYKRFSEHHLVHILGMEFL